MTGCNAFCHAGVRFGPPGSKRLVYFVDDMNMPFVDKYDTQSAIELIRQSVDYRGWFDKVKIVLKEVTNTQYCACMNPTAGSFNITPRMQRHFVTFAVQMPHVDIVRWGSCASTSTGSLAVAVAACTGQMFLGKWALQ